MAERKPFTGYDQSEIADQEIKYRMENWQDHYDEKPTQEQVAERVYRDSDIFQMAWDDMVESLTEAMNEIKATSYWYAEGRNLGWQARSGHAFIKAPDAKALLNGLLPKTDVTLKIFKTKRQLDFVVYHHDAPTGEFYTVRPATQKMINDGNFR
jgi:hypothetical protein